MNKENIEVRDIKDGEWYWIHKAILYCSGKTLRSSGVAVYNALALFSNSKTQTCFPTQKAIADITGLSKRSVMRKIKLLRKLRLIKTERKKNGNLYYLLRPDVTGITPSDDRKDISKVTGGNTNNNKRTRSINNIDYIKSLKSDFRAFKGRNQKTREKLLACDLVEALNDPKGLPFYLSLAKKYPESLLRKVLGEVKEIPSHKIKKSRGALFNHLIQKYAKEASNNHWN